MTLRKRAEEALRESEGRFRAMAEAIEDVFYVDDLGRGALAYLSPAYERIWGRPAADLLANLASLLGTTHPDDRPAFLGRRTARERGGPVVTEYRIVRPGGEVRWMLDRSFPMPGPAGTRAAGVAQDVTPRKEAEREVRASRRRLRSLAEGIPQLVWSGVDGGEWTWASPQWSAYTGLPREASVGRGWLDALHPDDRAGAMEAWARAEAGGRLEADYRVLHAAEGRHRWFQPRATPVRDEATGAVVEWLRHLDGHRRHGPAPRPAAGPPGRLRHRTRNLLGVVRAVADRTLGPGPAVEEFDSRLAAIGRVQGFLARGHGWSVDLEALVGAELEAHADGASDQVAVGGPRVELTGEEAQPLALALALHELATNAVKHGALAHPGAGCR